MIYPVKLRGAALSGMTQLELATLVGVSPAAIKRIEARGDELRFEVDTMLPSQEALDSHAITFLL
jgi:transcriptional regulator with XRE-family HTH domain